MPKSDHTTLTVILGDEIANAIDQSLSPVDGIIAIKQVLSELPDLHCKCRSRRRFRRFGTALPIYRGLIDWAGIGIEYVEHHGYLHIVGLCDIDAGTADVAIGDPADDAQYLCEIDCGGGVSIIG